MSTPTLTTRASSTMMAALIALVAGCASTPTPSPDTGARPAANATTTASSGPESTLQKGMTAEAAKAIMGEPNEIKPLKSSTGKAEIWVYHRRIQGAVQQVMVGVKSTPIMVTNSSGQMVPTQSIDEPILRQQAEIIEETVNLLIFDGKYIEQTRSAQRHLEYQ